MNLQKNTMTMEQLLEQLIKKVRNGLTYREREENSYQIPFMYKVLHQVEVSYRVSLAKPYRILFVYKVVYQGGG